MRVHYNVTGSDRKPLVKIVSETTGEQAVYKYMPTCSYEIGAFTVTKDGTLEYADGADANAVIAALVEAGYVGEQETAAVDDAGFEETDADPEAEDSEENSADDDTEGVADGASDGAIDNEQAAAVDGMTVEMPRSFFTDSALDNLQRLVDSKAGLIKKALGAEELPIHISDDKVSFPWFSEPDPDSAAAYTKFVSALCQMAKNAKRVTAQDHDVDNEKYAFRCFLLRLGFIGAEYKADRKILLKNLTGSSAFKSGSRKGDGNEVSE